MRKETRRSIRPGARCSRSANRDHIGHDSGDPDGHEIYRRYEETWRRREIMRARDGS